MYGQCVIDIYHQQISDGVLTTKIAGNIDKIAHFHSAGVPGRHELFRGEINYPFLLQELERLGYRGGFGPEYWPTLDAPATLRPVSTRPF